MPRPNLILFLTDDHGHWTLPCYGNPIVRAPALSALARRGMVFDRAFTPSPVCSPARASLLTGRMPSGHGIHDWIPEARDDGTYPHIDGMPGNLVERLRRAGYETAYVGKYHCNHAQTNPLKFDYWFTHKPPVQYDCSRQQVWFDNGQEPIAAGPQAKVITRAACDFLKSRNPDKPFCLIIGHINTHTPHTGEEEQFVRLFHALDDPGVALESFSEAHGRKRFLPRESRVDFSEQLTQYYAAVEAIDHEVARILVELDTHDLLDSTCLFYTSDHGHMNGQHGLHTKGNATVPVNFIEESIRVPLIAAGPGVSAGSRSSALVDHCDLYATFLDLAGLAPESSAPDGTALPGGSFATLLRGQAHESKPYQFCEYGNARMIRSGRYKLIRRYPGPNGHFPDELYDLANDPRETVNCLGDPATAEAARELSRELDTFFDTYSTAENSGLRTDQLARFHSTSCWNIDAADFPVIYQ